MRECVCGWSVGFSGCKAGEEGGGQQTVMAAFTRLGQKVFFTGVSVGSDFCSVPKHCAHTL